MNSPQKSTAKLTGTVCVVDRFLLFFLFLLFSYLIFLLVTGVDNSQNTDTVNVIVRTWAAAIFGYFISGNFTPQEPAPPVSGKTTSR